MTSSSRTASARRSRPTGAPSKRGARWSPTRRGATARLSSSAGPPAEVEFRRLRGVDDLVGGAGGEETAARVEVAAGGEGDLDRIRCGPARDPRVPAAEVADNQAGVVAADRVGADEDRVAARAHL